MQRLREIVQRWREGRTQRRHAEVGERSYQDDLLRHGELWLQAEWVDRQNSRDRWRERDRETDKCSKLRVTYPLVDSALWRLQQLSTNPKCSVQQDHTNQKTASLQRPSVVMLTACERKKNKTLCEILIYTLRLSVTVETQPGETPPLSLL